MSKLRNRIAKLETRRPLHPLGFGEFSEVVCFCREYGESEADFEARKAAAGPSDCTIEVRMKFDTELKPPE
ncbi:MAG: hypothetical protein ABL973_04590 [Micropepsaceae bacterium]